MEEILYIGFSAPFADERQVDQLVRDLTTSLPLGALLAKDARAKLAKGAQPSARGSVSDQKLSEHDFQEAFAVACRHAGDGVGVKLIVGDERISLLRPAEIIRAQKAPKRQASDLLYGPRRV